MPMWIQWGLRGQLKGIERQARDSDWSLLVSPVPPPNRPVTEVVNSGPTSQDAYRLRVSLEPNPQFTVLCIVNVGGDSESERPEMWALDAQVTG
jgi:hypothetical protein